MEQFQPTVFALFSRPRVVIDHGSLDLRGRRKIMDSHWIIGLGRGVCGNPIFSTK